MLILLSMNFGNCRRLFAGFPQDLFGVRRRSNAFDEHTSNESRTYAIIILLLCLSEGILCFSGLNTYFGVPSSVSVFTLTMICSGVALAYYLIQLIVYRTVGFAFTDSVGTHQWLRCFNASQAILAFSLLVPALVSLFYPAAASLMLHIGIFCYIISRILFICKGFRIFFKNFPSLLYFILYLCALEIAPLIFIARMAAVLASSEQSFLC